MSSKVKNYNHYLVREHTRTKARGCHVKHVYIVAAKNEKEALNLTKNKYGKYLKLSISSNIDNNRVKEILKEYNKEFLNYKEVIKYL